MFDPVEANVNFPKLEEEILRFWREAGIYEKSLARRRDENAPRFVFYEGPPTANGKPHPGHCLTRAIKDLFPRYRTMRGYLCERKAGWDTHGLPVEVEVCKELGIHSKEEIENYGIEPFIQKCQQSVWRYMQEWRQMTERIGFWVDLDQAYVTYHQSYVESVWWSLKQLFDRGLLYQGHKIVWWWAQGGTALSSGEVGQGYREVADPSVYVKFPLVSDERTKELGLDGASLLVWTTTPWTLPSNQFVAVHPELDYVLLQIAGTDERIIVANELLDSVVRATIHPSKKQSGPVATPGIPQIEPTPKYFVANAIKGSDLIGLRYEPPFHFFRSNKKDRTPKVKVADLQSKWLEYRFGVAWVTGLSAQFIQQVVTDQELAEKFVDSQWRIFPATFVTTSSGTGIVHIAPAFGEDDFEILKQATWIKVTLLGPNAEAVPLICPVGPDGKFTAEVLDYEGQWVKAADKQIIQDLKNNGVLFHRDEYRHEYPFCWRAEEDPLIQYPRRSWFIATSQFKELMLDNNRRINWLPEHIKDGRFGNFLETNVDWALSRERFWGTPLPIWICDKDSNHREAVSSYEELLDKPESNAKLVWQEARSSNPELVEDLKVHKPYIDRVTYKCQQDSCNGAMRRVTEVIDCWYDSGAMPFAQWGYRDQNPRSRIVVNFREQFPADFISEALDQTRGWFYSQLAISTVLWSESREVLESTDSLGIKSEELDSAAYSTHFSPLKDYPYPHPFRNCIVLGLMLGEDGQKMSKSKRNYREPGEIFDKYGADALRWYFFATQPPWTTIRYSERAIKESIPEFLLRLWNVYSFFVIYANIDAFDPAAEIRGQESGVRSQDGERAACGLAADDLAAAKSYRPIKTRAELDRWILGELNLTAKTVVERMDAYDNYGAAQRIIEFVDALSNWYVRRSRDRFWSEDKRDPDKLDAYWTLYECLLTIAKIIAPFVPFLAEAMWRNLGKQDRGTRDEGRESADSYSPFAPRSLPLAFESVHLADFPTGDPKAIDEQLSLQMGLVREIASLGLAARMGAKLKVRQPLGKVEVILADRGQQAFLEGHVELLKKELNVKQVEFTEQADHYITYTVLPDLKRLGPRLGKKLPLVKNALAKADAAKLLAGMEAAGKVALDLGDGTSESLDRDDLQVRLQAKPGWAAAQGKACVVVLSTELSPELITEGLAREIVHAIQSARKDTCCEYTDRIEVGIVTESAEIRRAVEQFADYIRSETLAVSIVLGPVNGVAPIEIKIGEDSLQLYVRIAKKK